MALYKHIYLLTYLLTYLLYEQDYGKSVKDSVTKCSDEMGNGSRITPGIAQELHLEWLKNYIWNDSRITWDARLHLEWLKHYT